MVDANACEPRVTDMDLENVPIPIHLLEGDGTILWANRAELQWLGYAREEFVGQNIAAFHLDTEVIQGVLRRLAGQEEVRDVESQMRAQDGTSRWVLLNAHIRQDRGRVIHACYSTDITDYVLHGRAVERHREWFRTVLASIGDAVIATDARGRVTLMNSVSEALTGWTAAEAVSRPLSEVFPILNENTRQPAPNPVQHVLETGRIVGLANHTILMARDGTEFAIDDSAAPIRDASGQLQGVVLVFRDIGERRRLAAAARHLAAIVESSDDAIVSKNLDGIVSSWNQGAERLFGYSAEEMIGRPISILIPPDRPDEEPEILRRIRRGERLDHFETVRMHKDGSRLDVSVTISPVKDESGEIVGASKVARDIGTEKRLRDELERRLEELAEADRRKDAFLAMLAHELRNPLGAISNAVSILESARQERPRSRAMKVLRRQVDHQARLVNQLLDVSRITRNLIELHLEELDLVQLVRDTVEDFRASSEAQHLELALDLSSSPIWVEADRTRIAQVVTNLLSNSLKFTPSGGRVTVDVHTTAAGSRAEIIVSDTGIGIAEELLPHVFESFSHGEHSLARTRGGLGLGLAIVKGLCELHGGEVHVESGGTGKGTRVRVLLPALDSPERGIAPEEAASHEHEGPLRILVVEDNVDAAETLADLLELDGHEVQIALTGPEGVRLAQENHPDVVLCDLGLPGMDGYEVAAALRLAPGGRRPRLVAVTGYGGDANRRRSREAGFDDHIVKPIDAVALARILAGVASTTDSAG